MKPEDRDEPDTTSEESEVTRSEVTPPEGVFPAEIVDTPESIADESPEIVDAALVPSGTSLADVFDSAKNESSQGQPGERLWPEQIATLPSQPRPPLSKSCRNARIAFAIAAMVTFAFLIFFLAEEIRLKQNGLIIIRRSLLIVFVLLGNLAGIFRVQREHVPGDARYTAWSGLLITGACFLFVLPPEWSWFCFGWAVFQMLPIFANAFAPAEVAGEEIKFDLNDSVAANGGSVASVVLGFWSILGSLFTSLSIINSILGVLLGLWGLNSRKKGMAVFGIILCVLGILACMMNVTYVFWEMIQVQEEELLQSAQ